METKLQSYVREKVMDNVLKMDTRQGRVMLMEPIRKQYEEFEKEVEKLINIENSKLYCVQCDDCCKWRFMPSNYYHDTSREWTCYHPDHVAHNPEFASCDQPEEDPSLIPVPPPSRQACACAGLESVGLCGMVVMGSLRLQGVGRVEREGPRQGKRPGGGEGEGEGERGGESRLARGRSDILVRPHERSPETLAQGLGAERWLAIHSEAHQRVPRGGLHGPPGRRDL